MKHLLLAAGLLISVCSPAHAQERVTIRSNQFAEEIIALKSAWEQIHREFEVRINEVSVLSERIEKATSEIEDLQRTGAPASPESDAKVEAVLKLRVELSKKTDAYQAEWERRKNQVVGPVANKIEAAMAEYLAARGVQEVFDLDAGDQAPPGTPDVSRDFVNWFNTRK